MRRGARRPGAVGRALTVALAFACLVTVTEAAQARSVSCARAVIDDWAAGGLDASHPLHCYREALAVLPEDIRIYSSAPDDIRQALDTRTTRPAKAVRKVAAVEQTRSASSDRRTEAEAGGGMPAPVFLAGALALVLLGFATAGALLHRRLNR